MLLRFSLAAVVFHNRDPNPRRQLVHRNGKIDMLVVHHEAKNAAPHATPKAVKGLALGTDREGRRFFLMKRTERLKTRARSLERKLVPDTFNNIVRGTDLFIA